MLYRMTQRAALALWHSPIVRRFLFHQTRRLITAALINRTASQFMRKQPDAPSERIVIPVMLED